MSADSTQTRTQRAAFDHELQQDRLGGSPGGGVIAADRHRAGRSSSSLRARRGASARSAGAGRAIAFGSFLGRFDSMRRFSAAISVSVADAARVAARTAHRGATVGYLPWPRRPVRLHRSATQGALRGASLSAILRGENLEIDQTVVERFPCSGFEETSAAGPSDRAEEANTRPRGRSVVVNTLEPSSSRPKCETRRAIPRAGAAGSASNRATASSAAQPRWVHIARSRAVKPHRTEPGEDGR